MTQSFRKMIITFAVYTFLPFPLNATTFICPFKFGTALVQTAHGNESIFMNNNFAPFSVGSGLWSARIGKDEVLLTIRRYDGDTMRANIDF